MMFKVLAIISLLAIAATGWTSYVAGGNAVRVSMSNAQEAERRTQAEKIEVLIALNKVEKVVYRDKIKIVNSTFDTTGCNNKLAPDDILNSVRQYDSIAN